MNVKFKYLLTDMGLIAHKFKLYVASHVSIFLQNTHIYTWCHQMSLCFLQCTYVRSYVDITMYVTVSMILAEIM